MYIVVTNDSTRVPPDLVERRVQIEQWSLGEFIDRANSEDGMDLDEALYFDVSVLTSEIYESLRPYKEYEQDGNKIIYYYRFDDMPMPVDFIIDDDVIVFETEKPEPIPEPEPEPEPVIEEVQPVEELEPEPIPEPEPEPVAPPQPAIPTPEPTPQPVYQQPVQQPVYQQPAPQPVVQQPVYTPPEPQYQQPVYQPQPTSSIPLQKEEYIPPETPSTEQKTNSGKMDKITRRNLDRMLSHDDFDADSYKKAKNRAPAKVILFGSSKGGTGKTFTCLVSAYWYAKSHPNEKVALADFDIIDGQIGITVNKLTPTMMDFYKQYNVGNNSFGFLEACKVKSEHFSPNLDFYLAPPQDIPQITNDTQFWYDLFQALITNYDVVFFDSGIDYLGKAPISQLYKIADRIIVTTNPSINSTKSIIKQLKTLSGQRENPVFTKEDDILSRVKLVLTRVYDNKTINDIVANNLEKFAPIIAEFGNIDKIISEVQWYQHWDLIDKSPEVYEQLEKIINLDDDDDEYEEEEE